MAWSKIAGYEDLYEVSDTGDVRSLDREYIDSMGRHTIKRSRILHPSISVYGYKRVSLTRNKRTKTYFVHKLVAQAFIPNPHKYLYVNHKDENKLNNNVKNLEWCTAQYNCNYGTRNERMKNKLRLNSKSAKPIIATTTNGKKEYYSSIREARRVLGYLHNGISNALNGRTHTACNRTWEFAEE